MMACNFRSGNKTLNSVVGLTTDTVGQDFPRRKA